MRVEPRIAERIRFGDSAMMVMQQEADAATRSGATLTHLLRGEPDFDTPPHIVAAAEAAIRAGKTHYTAAWGLPVLREAIAARVTDTTGRRTTAAEVLVTTGASQGLFSAIMAVVDPGDEVLTFEPYYGPWNKMVELAGGHLVTAPLANDGGTFRVDTERLAAAVSPRTKVLLINSPMNPTGRVFTRSELTALAETALRHELLIVSDETYDAIVYPDHVHVSIASLGPEVAERTMIVNSFSKTYAMTGWRIGFNVAPGLLTKATHAVFSQSGRMAAAFTQEAAFAAVTGDQEPVTAMLREYARRRDLIVAELERIGQRIVAPEGTFYIFLDGGHPEMSSLDLARNILRLGGVVTSPGSFFGPGADRCIRLSFAASDTDIVNGVAGLDTALRALATTDADAVGRIPSPMG